MYCPHRNKNIKSDSFNTFEEMFLSEEKVIIENMSRFETLTQDLDDAWQRLQKEGSQEHAWAQIGPNTERDRADQAEELELLRQVEEFEEIDMDDIPDLNIEGDKRDSDSGANSVKTISERNTSEDIRTLNAEQSQLFYFVRDWALKKAEVRL